MLAEEGEGNSDDLLSTAELAAWLGVSVQFLQTGRSHGYGPRFVKIGRRRVRYRRGDVLDWLNERTHRYLGFYFWPDVPEPEVAPIDEQPGRRDRPQRRKPVE